MFLSVFFRRVLLFCIAIILICCNNKTEDWDNAGLWLNNEELFDRDDMLDWEDVAYSIVPDDQRIEYINHLEDEKYVVLGKNEYFNFTGKNLEKQYGLAVRAVRAHRGGHFTVLKSYENEYFVGYFVLGPRAWELSREILIIEADELPIELFISYSVAR